MTEVSEKPTLPALRLQAADTRQPLSSRNRDFSTNDECMSARRVVMCLLRVRMRQDEEEHDDYLPGDFGVSTYHDRTIYLHVLHPAGTTLSLPALPTKILSCSSLTGGSADCKQTND